MAIAYKVLGQQAPASTSNVDVYTVGAGKSAIVSSLIIANTTASSATARVFLRIGGAAAATSNALAYDVTVSANSHAAFTEGWTMAATDVLTVQSGTSNALTFTLTGSEIS